MASASFVDGIALAATLTGDRTGAAGAGLSVELSRALASRLQEIRSAGRERALGAIAAGLRPRIDPSAALPPRAAAILAPEVPRAIGAPWMARGPLPRAGFRVPASLRATLRRLARPPRDDGERARDRAQGRAALADALHGPLDRAAIMEALGPAEASEVEATAPGAEEDRALRAARAAVLLATGSGPEISTRLGAIERSREDGSDRWARAARETRWLWERGCRG